MNYFYLSCDKMSDDEEFPELIGEDKGEGSISMKLYYHFFRAGGNILLLLALIAIFILGEVSILYIDTARPMVSHRTVSIFFVFDA